MSLINQVLCDLQGRHVSCGDTGLQAQIRPVSLGRRRFHLMTLAVGGALVLLLGLQLFLPLTGKDSRSEEGLVGSSSIEALSPITATNEPPRVMRKLLAAVQLNSAANSSRLLLEFSQPSARPLKVQVMGHRMVIPLPELIPDIQNLPQPGANDALVSHLELLQHDQIWQLEVLFKVDVRVDKLSLAADRIHGERLVIDIFPQAVETVEVAVTAPVLIDEIEREPKVKRLQGVAEVAKKIRVLTTAEQADEHYRRGVESARNQQMQSALQSWRKALRLQPGYLQARKQLILGLLMSNRALADDLFTEGLILHEPLALRKWYARAVLPVAGPAQAVAILTGQKVSVGEDEEYRALQAGLWQQAGDFSSSLKGYLELLQAFPDNNLYLFGLAVALDQQARGQGALENYQKALDAGLESKLQAYARSRIEFLVTNIGAEN